jgi:methionyl-tRNA formyltransferase
MTRRIVFMGTPDYSRPSLETLARAPGVEVALVVTQPDRAAGRGRKLLAPPVKVAAEQLGLPVHQAASLKTVELRQPIVDAKPDLIVVAAFGLILGRSILELPPLGCINLHASLLPRYRGAAPISAAILRGDPVTGVTLMGMERGLDTGPIHATMDVDIHHFDTTESLTDRLAIAAATLLEGHLEELLDGSSSSTPQPPGATLTRPLAKADGWIDWTVSAEQIERHVRAMWPWPRAWTKLPSGEPFQIHAASIEPRDTVTNGDPGTMRAMEGSLLVQCGEGTLMIQRGQLPGGKPLTGSQLATRSDFSGPLQLGIGEPPTTPGPLIVDVG